MGAYFGKKKKCFLNFQECESLSFPSPCIWWHSEQAPGRSEFSECDYNILCSKKPLSGTYFPLASESILRNKFCCIEV